MVLFYFFFFHIASDAGQLVLWSKQGARPTVHAVKKSFIKESWTITLLTSLVHNPPIVFVCTPDASNAETYVDFVSDCIPFLWPGGALICDNCSFHCKGKKNLNLFFESIPEFLFRLGPRFAHICIGFSQYQLFHFTDIFAGAQPN